MTCSLRMSWSGSVEKDGRAAAMASLCAFCSVSFCAFVVTAVAAASSFSLVMADDDGLLSSCLYIVC